MLLRPVYTLHSLHVLVMAFPKCSLLGGPHGSFTFPLYYRKPIPGSLEGSLKFRASFFFLPVAEKELTAWTMDASGFLLISDAH